MSAEAKVLLESLLSGVDDEARRSIVENSTVVSYSFGEALSCFKKESSDILVIVSGVARLLCNDGTDWIEASKLGYGDWVGLASLLSQDACEEVIASGDIEALRFPKSIIAEYIEKHPFSSTFHGKCLPAERTNLLVKIWNREHAHAIGLKEFLLFFSGLVDVVTNANPLDPKGCRYFACSGKVGGLEYASEVEHSAIQEIQSNSPLLRFLSIEWPEDEGVFTNRETLDISEKELSDLDYQDNTSHSTVTDEKLISSIKRKLGRKPIDRIDACLLLVDILAEFFNIRFLRDATYNIFKDAIKRRGKIDLSVIRAAFEFHGLQITSGIIDPRVLHRIETPSIIEYNDSFSIIYSVQGETVYLVSPDSGFLELKKENILEILHDELVFLHIERSDLSPTKRFGIGWVLPFLAKYKGALVIVLVASLVSQILGLVGPLLVQVIIDKVINQRSIDTLQILGISLIVVTIMEGLLGSLRTILFTQTTNKIDLKIGTKVIDRLLRLPVSYFDTRPVGELSSRLSELEKIRSFLTGQVLTTSLDAFLSLVYIIVMVMYSVKLTLVALSVVPLQVAITVLGAPIFRLQYRDAAQKNAKTQSHLVEVLTGIQTVKSQNIEGVSRSKWQDFYSKYISSSFGRVILETSLSESTQTLQKLSQLLVLWVGSVLVLDGKITLGQLIAFRIISGYVTQPLLRLSTIWQNVQELKVSFERLGDIVDTPQECDFSSTASRISIPPIQGDLEFKEVSYKFPSTNKIVLCDISVKLNSGLFVGVVGKSGSGKSTLAKLVARLSIPLHGSITMDGYDINKVELYSYRRQIGIVPQEPLLFNGSIFHNITLGNPDATSDEVIRVSKIACAHEFIMSSTEGYDTNVGERGLSLSGGQRQRIALARTLLGKPKFLILDEATSALDYYTENQVFRNLRSHLQGSTVIFITHRLTTMPLADKVLMMDSGHIAEIGTHSDLMKKRGSYFSLFTNKEIV